MKGKGPVSVVCKICGGKFMKHSYPIHLPRCQKKFDASHTLCDRCGRQVSNSDWSLHRADCKKVKMPKRRPRKAAEPQRLPPPKSGLCQECDEDKCAVYCKECEQYMCNGCTKLLHRKGARSRHTRTKIEDLDKPQQPRMAAAPDVENTAVGGPGAYNIDALPPEAFAPPPEEDMINREECRICGRRFAVDRIYVHERVCQKRANKKKKRKTWDGAKKRVEGTEFEQFFGKKRPTTPPEIQYWKEHGRRWKQERGDFRDLIETQAMLKGVDISRDESKNAMASIDHKEPRKRQTHSEERKSVPPPSLTQSANLVAKADTTPASRQVPAVREPTPKRSAPTPPRQPSPKQSEPVPEPVAVRQVSGSRRRSASSRRSSAARKRSEWYGAEQASVESVATQQSTEATRAVGRRDSATRRSLPSQAGRDRSSRNSSATRKDKPSQRRSASLKRNTLPSRRRSSTREKPTREKIAQVATLNQRPKRRSSSTDRINTSSTRLIRGPSGEVRVRSTYQDRALARKRGEEALKRLRKSKDGMKSLPSAQNIAVRAKRSSSKDLMKEGRRKLTGRGRVPSPSAYEVTRQRQQKSASRSATLPAQPSVPKAARMSQSNAHDPTVTRNAPMQPAVAQPAAPSSTSPVNPLPPKKITSMEEYVARERLRREAARNQRVRDRKSPSNKTSQASHSVPKPAAVRPRPAPAAPAPAPAGAGAPRQSTPTAETKAVDKPDIPVAKSGKSGDAFTVPGRSSKKPLKAMPKLSSMDLEKNKGKPKKESAFKPKAFHVKEAGAHRQMKSVLDNGSVRRVLAHDQSAAPKSDQAQVRQARAQFLAQLMQ